MPNNRVRLVTCSCAALLGAMLVAVPSAQVPIATPIDEATAQLTISQDGSEVTFRRPAPDDLRICVEPQEFGKRICFTVGDVRAGRVRVAHRE